MKSWQHCNYSGILNSSTFYVRTLISYHPFNQYKKSCTAFTVRKIAKFYSHIFWKKFRVINRLQYQLISRNSFQWRGNFCFFNTVTESCLLLIFFSFFSHQILAWPRLTKSWSILSCWSCHHGWNRILWEWYLRSLSNQ